MKTYSRTYAVALVKRGHAKFLGKLEVDGAIYREIVFVETGERCRYLMARIGAPKDKQVDQMWCVDGFKNKDLSLAELDMINYRDRGIWIRLGLYQATTGNDACKQAKTEKPNYKKYRAKSLS